MEEKFKSYGSQKKLRLISGVIVGALLVVLEILIIAQYARLKPAAWSIALVIVCEFALDVLCLIELFAVKSFKFRITIYSFDFVFLLIISTLTGNTYLSALYCIILTQLYINVDDFKSKLVVFVTSCVLFIVTCVVGRLLNNSLKDYSEIMDLVTQCLINLMILLAHFVVANFLVVFSRNNKKLTAALKEADERKKQLEEAYEQLSTTAVFEERNRIARDIHDNAGHSMTAVIMQTEAAKLLIDSDPEQAKSKIISANIQAKNALEQMRESVHLLAGRNVSSTLREDLEEILAQTMDGTDIKIRYDIADLSLPYLKRRFICNCLKECLANGMRHGGATAFYVELSVRDDSFVGLTVSDNGTGLPEEFKEGYGIRGMREKAQAFGGEIVYESEHGEGAEFTVTVPLHGEEEEKND